MLGLELLEPVDQPVIIVIVDLRRRFDVVFPVVMPDFLAKPLDFAGNVGRHGQTDQRPGAGSPPPSSTNGKLNGTVPIFAGTAAQRWSAKMGLSRLTPGLPLLTQKLKQPRLNHANRSSLPVTTGGRHAYVADAAERVGNHAQEF